MISTNKDGDVFIEGMTSVKSYAGKQFKVVRLELYLYTRREFSAKNTVNEDKLKNNLIRAKTTMFEIAFCNKWDWFVTGTIDPAKYDRYSLKQYRRDFSKMIDNQNQKNGYNIKYLFIPEQHKDGAWHIHGFFTGIPRERLRRNENDHFEWDIYRDKFGFMSMGAVRSHEACSRYVMKYITKDIMKENRELGEHVYFASKGLERAKLIGRYVDVPMLTHACNAPYCQIKWFRDEDEALAVAAGVCTYDELVCENDVDNEMDGWHEMVEALPVGIFAEG